MIRLIVIVVIAPKEHNAVSRNRHLGRVAIGQLLQCVSVVRAVWLITTSDSKITAAESGMTTSDTCMCTCRKCVRSSSTPASTMSPQCVMRTDNNITPSYATVQHDLLIAGQPRHYVEWVHLGYRSFYMLSVLHSSWSSSHTYLTVCSRLHRLGSESLQHIGGWLWLNSKSSLHINLTDDPGQCRAPAYTSWVNHVTLENSLLRLWCFNSRVQCSHSRGDVVILESDAVRCGLMP